MDIKDYIFNKLQGRMLELLREAIKKEEYATAEISSLSLEDAVASDAIKQLGGTLEEGDWTPPSNSILYDIVDRDGSDAYYYLLSLEDGRWFFIKLTPTTLDVTDELSDNALEATFYNIVQALQYVYESMSEH